MGGGGGTLDELAASACWRALCLLAERVRSCREPVRSCWLRIGDPVAVALNSCAPPPGSGWSVRLEVESGAGGAEGAEGAGVAEGAGGGRREPQPPAAGESRYVVEDLVMLRRVPEGARASRGAQWTQPQGPQGPPGELPAAAAALLETYAPYCLAGAYARRVGRAFAVSHFAQSLDGRIATGSGDSKWIGCAENLLHAHRMRALCDGVIIGSRTLRHDHPALTVRHTEGADPTRIVVGQTRNGDLDCLLRAGPGPILLIGDGEEPASRQVERLALPRSGGRFATGAILEELYRRGVFSVYIEGGAVTTSAFLADRTIDVLQLHISPLILGGGIPSFSRPGIHAVAESVRFATSVYRPVGDGILFAGRVAPCEPCTS